MTATPHRQSIGTAVPDSREHSYWEWGALLLHQQCWCWGQDIRRPQGNLLLEYGFSRSRPPEGMSGCSRYCYRDEASILYLWGFGVAFGCVEGHAIVLNRYSFAPRWYHSTASLERVWNADQLSETRPPAFKRQRNYARRQLRTLLRCIARYEAWVLESRGIDYRRSCLREWHRPAILPGRMPREWQQLSWHIPDLPLGPLAASSSSQTVVLQRSSGGEGRPGLCRC
jgi:hypothetical protein